MIDDEKKLPVELNSRVKVETSPGKNAIAQALKDSEDIPERSSGAGEITSIQDQVEGRYANHYSKQHAANIPREIPVEGQIHPLHRRG
ncbi:hypothetical protein [Pseudomonas aeruginosa]